MKETAQGIRDPVCGMEVDPKNSAATAQRGDGPFGYITTGGMFTVLKIHEGITSNEDPGWYKHPEGTVALAAAAEDLRRDNIEVPQGQATPGTGTS